MQIIRNTQEQLILRSIPWVTTILLTVFLLAVLGFGLNALFAGDYESAFWGLLVLPLFVGLFLVIFVRRDEVIFDRSRDLLELRHSTFRGRIKVQHKLRHLERAKQESGSCGKGTTYRIALVLNGGMDAGIHPVAPLYASGTGAQRGVDTINAWIAQDVDSGSTQD